MHAHHLAHVHAGNALIRIRVELACVAEGDLQLVAARLERRRPAERAPDEEDQAHARERECRGDRDNASAWCLRDHLPAPGQPDPVPSTCSATAPTAPDWASDEHEPIASPRMTAPFASPVEKTEFALCANHEFQ